MDFPDPYASLRDRKLVVLGIPFDVETDELKYYMRKFGELEDCIVMKDRLTSQSRGFGYVTFMSVEDAKKACTAHHVLNGRVLDVKVATPKDEMTQSTARKGGRIFVARIPSSVTETMFRSYFQKYGVVIDAYMPKDVGSRMHRGIGFVTFENAEAVDKIMNEAHELDGSTVAVDRATPKEDTPKYWGNRHNSDQSNKLFSDQWTRDFYEQWSKMTPEQWAKFFPESWSKGFPDQFGLFMAAAAAAFNGMEGFDFSAYGFPTSTSNEKSENPWNAFNTERTKDSRTPPVSESPAGPSVSQSTTGYVPQTKSDGLDASKPENPYNTGLNRNPASSYTFSSSGSNPNSDSNYSIYSASNSGPGFASNAPPTTSYRSIQNPDNYAGPGNSAASSYYGSVPPYHTSGAPPHTYSSEYGSLASASTGPYPSSSYGPGGGYGTSGPYGSGCGNYGPSESGYGSSNGSYGPGGGYGPSCSTSGMFISPNSGSKYNSDSQLGYVVPPVAEHSPHPSYASSHYNETAPGYKTSGLPIPTMRNKVFIGKLPHEATAEHLRTYFSSFGRILDVYVPKDAKKTGHRGFGFVTFFDDGVAERVANQSHEILGQPVAVDRPTPQENSRSSTSNASNSGHGYGNHSFSMHRTGHGSRHSNHGYFAESSSYGGQSSYFGPGFGHTPRSDSRYRPY